MTRWGKIGLVGLAMLVWDGGFAGAVMPDEILADPHLEARAREISSQLRCLVCRNESIDESNADLARDLRLLVRERLQAGDSNDDVLAYIRGRYGDYVLLNPPVMGQTILLWLGPGLLFLVGLGLILRPGRRRTWSRGRRFLSGQGMSDLAKKTSIDDDGRDAR